MKFNTCPNCNNDFPPRTDTHIVCDLYCLVELEVKTKQAQREAVKEKSRYAEAN